MSQTRAYSVSHPPPKASEFCAEDVATQPSTVSADGKTRTVTTKGVNAAGQKVNNVAVYIRSKDASADV